MSTTIPLRPDHAVVDVRPGDQAAATEVEGWLQDHATSRDPVLRDRIILAYLGLADRLASRYRHSRGTTPEDLTQTARAGLIAAVDRSTPPTATRSSPALGLCGRRDEGTCVTEVGCCMAAPAKNRRSLCRHLMICTSAGPLTHHQRAGRGFGMGEEEVLVGLAAMGSRVEVSLDQPVGDDGEASLGDLVAASGAREEPEDLLVLPGLVAALPALEREVIVLRFFQDLDQYEIAARVGFSQMHISRLRVPWRACTRSWCITTGGEGGCSAS